MDKNYIVTKSNRLISTSYDLSLQEQKIILTLASMVQPQDTEFHEYEFKIKDFMELLNVDTKTKYTELPRITRELKKKVFDIEEGTDLIQVSWLGGVRNKRKEGILILSLDKGLKPYMLELKELYTSYKLENVLTMKSKYSIRFYEILKSNQFKKTIEIEVEEIRGMIGAMEKTYDLYSNFKSKILLKSQKELNTKTDLSFDFEEIKTGRKVTSIKFIIKSNKTVNKVNDPKAKEVQNEIAIDDEVVADIELIKDFTENEFSLKTMTLFRDICNGDIVKIKRVYEYMSTKNITENRTGYMRTLLENWEEPKQSNSKTGFNNFEPRQYDYDELEKRLLGWDKE